jgi:tripartite ATP-independent transporter DctP family solute receptor
LAWGENGFRHLTNSKRPVQTPDDLKGLKLRTMENPVHITAFRALGAVPTAMAFPEVYAALQQGVVDGQENPIPVISSSRFGYVQKHLTLTGHVYSPALIIMSKSLFDGLSAPDKKLFQDAARVGARVMRERVTEIEKSGLAELQAQGVKVVTSVDKERFRAALSGAYAEYAQRFDKAQIERIRNVK